MSALPIAREYRERRDMFGISRSVRFTACGWRSPWMSLDGPHSERSMADGFAYHVRMLDATGRAPLGSSIVLERVEPPAPASPQARPERSGEVNHA